MVDKHSSGGDDGPSEAEARDLAAEHRDRAADQRDHAAEERDQAGDHRDEAGDRRDDGGDERDRAGDERDQSAQERDELAERFEASDGAVTLTEARGRSAKAREEAASDRNGASRDRRSGALERAQADADRKTALADRESGASERTHAGLDRNTALADRGAAAREREDASVDELTGVYVRGAGLVELEREMARARRARQPLVVALVEVDRLNAVADGRGIAAGERMLVEVADVLQEELRSSDLIIHYRDDEFICAVTGLHLAGAAKRFALVSAALAEPPEHGSVTVGLAELQAGDSAQDLVARADAARGRQRQLDGRAVVPAWECGDLVVDEGTQSVTRAGAPVPLTATEFKVLALLARNQGRLVPKAQLLGQVWGYEADDHIVAVHMSSLRRKLEVYGPRVVHTVRGSGYILRS